MRYMRGLNCVIVMLLLVALSLSSFALAVAGPQSVHLPNKRITPTTSGNWAGFAVTGSVGSVSDVKGSWIVPSVVSCSRGETSFSSFWVGIDGYASNTVEQIGTDSDCSKGVPIYFSWWEFYPEKYYVVSSPTPVPGHVFSAEVSYNSSTDAFTASITDTKTGSTFSITFQDKYHAQRSSAEWVTEGPLTEPLTHFTTSGLSPTQSAFYGSDYTSIASTNCAIISGFYGVSGCSGIGSYNSASPSSVYQMTMVAKKGATRASPSPLSKSGTSFYVAWVSTGP